MNDATPTQARRLDLATRAAWLYYINGATQDEIASEFDISRQSAQRLIALAVSERLIEFRIQSPVADCAALIRDLRARYRLSICDVVPSGPHDAGASVGLAAAQLFEAQIAQRGSAVFGFSTGRTLLKMAREISTRSRPDLSWCRSSATPRATDASAPMRSRCGWRTRSAQGATRSRCRS